MLTLTKGARIPLSKGFQGKLLFNFALGWDERKKANASEPDFDPDASMIVLHNSRPFQNPSDLLFYNSNVKEYDANGKPVWVDQTRPYPFIMDGALKSSGDERTGGKEGDDEVITMDFDKLGADVSHLVPVITIYDAATRNQNFGMMNNAFCRIEAPELKGFVTQKADLSEDASTALAFIPGFIYRDKENDWKYNSCQKQIFSTTLGNDGKAIGEVTLETIALNLAAILEIAVVA